MGYDKHPEAAVSGHRVIRWHSLGRAAAPFCWVRDPSPQQPLQWPFMPWQCDMMHFISYWEGVKLSDTHSSQATLFNKEHIITHNQLQRIKVAFPLQCILPMSLLLYFLCILSLSCSGLLLLVLSGRAEWVHEWYNCRGRKWCCWFNRLCFSFWVNTEQLSHCAQNILEQEVCLWCVWACVLISLTQNMERLHRRDFNYLESY